MTPESMRIPAPITRSDDAIDQQMNENVDRFIPWSPWNPCSHGNLKEEGRLCEQIKAIQFQLSSSRSLSADCVILYQILISPCQVLFPHLTE
eukprot:scaffold539_cov187-Ochromonas_danica.AAC.8